MRTIDYREATDALTAALHADDDGDELTHLTAARHSVDVLTTGLVLAMRARGESWATIGEALGISKQAAQQRYGRA